MCVFRRPPIHGRARYAARGEDFPHVIATAHGWWQRLPTRECDERRDVAQHEVRAREALQNVLPAAHPDSFDRANAMCACRHSGSERCPSLRRRLARDRLHGRNCREAGRELGTCVQQLVRQSIDSDQRDATRGRRRHDLHRRFARSLLRRPRGEEQQRDQHRGSDRHRHAARLLMNRRHALQLVN